VATTGAPDNRRKLMLFGGIGLAAAVVIGTTIWISSGDPTDSTQVIQIPPDTAGDPAERIAGPTPPPAPPPPPPNEGGETRRTTQNPPTRDPGESNPPGIRFASEEIVASVLEGMDERVLGDDQPPAAQLVAIRDTLVAVHTQTSTDDHRRTAARLLAIVESYRGNGPGCRRWVNEVRALGGDVTRLQPICPGGQP
jgi:hypothetical protein